MGDLGGLLIYSSCRVEGDANSCWFNYCGVLRGVGVGVLFSRRQERRRGDVVLRFYSKNVDPSVPRPSGWIADMFEL